MCEIEKEELESDEDGEVLQEIEMQTEAPKSRAKKPTVS